MTSVYRLLQTEGCNAKVTEHLSVHVLIVKLGFYYVKTYNIQSLFFKFWKGLYEKEENEARIGMIVKIQANTLFTRIFSILQLLTQVACLIVLCSYYKTIGEPLGPIGLSFSPAKFTQKEEAKTHITARKKYALQKKSRRERFHNMIWFEKNTVAFYSLQF